MKTIVVADTDVGIVKKTNQDSLCIRTADTKIGHVAMVVVCDGMGGLAKGELASATVVREFASWFENDFIQTIETWSFAKLSEFWNNRIKEINEKISDYGQKNNVKLGTTVTAFISINDEYMIFHVGVTRVYRISDDVNEQLTEDQTLVWREVKLGNLLPEQIETDPRRNILLQCVGASRTVVPEIKFGRIQFDSNYVVCSDGFRHVITPQEICSMMSPIVSNNESSMKCNIRSLIETVKSRKERDNITAVLIKFE